MFCDDTLFFPKICEESQFMQGHAKTQGRQGSPHSFLFVSISFLSIPIPFKNNLMHLSWNTQRYIYMSIYIYICMYVYIYTLTYVVLVLVLPFEFESNRLHFPGKSCIPAQVTKNICLLLADNRYLLTDKDWKTLLKLTYWKYFRAYLSEGVQASKWMRMSTARSAFPGAALGVGIQGSVHPGRKDAGAHHGHWGAPTLAWRPVSHLEVWSLCSRLTMLFTTKGSARATAKIALWSVVFLEINFQAAVRRFMADCLSSLPEVAQDLFMHEQGVSRCALA